MPVTYHGGSASTWRVFAVASALQWAAQGGGNHLLELFRRCADQLAEQHRRAEALTSHSHLGWVEDHHQILTGKLADRSWSPMQVMMGSAKLSNDT